MVVRDNKHGTNTKDNEMKKVCIEANVQTKPSKFRGKKNKHV